MAENANLGNSYLDFTDAAKVEEIKQWMIGSTDGIKYEFTAEGLKLTSEKSDGEFVIDFSKASPQVVLSRYDEVIITYKVTDGATEKIRMGVGSRTTPLQSARARNVTLTPDGEVHTASVTLKEMRVVNGYAGALGIYFEKNATAGKTVVIQSIQFVQTADAE